MKSKGLQQNGGRISTNCRERGTTERVLFPKTSIMELFTTPIHRVGIIFSQLLASVASVADQGLYISLFTDVVFLFPDDMWIYLFET